MDYKNSFVLYESVYAQYDRLMRRGKVQAAQDFIGTVMRYGLYGDEPDENKNGQLNVSEFARVCDMSRTTVYSYLKIIDHF